MAHAPDIRYRWRSGAMLRATTAPDIAHDLPRDLDLHEPNGLERGRAWLADVWGAERVRDAVSVASPALCQQVEDLLAGRPARPRQTRRVVLAVASYLLRWRQRPTPFGLFAGVAPVTVGDSVSVSWGADHRLSLRADGEWLADVVQRLEQCPGLLERLSVVAGDTGHVRGGRYVAPGPPADGRATLMAPIEISVRHTRPVAAALEAARAPIRYDELRAHLVTCFRVPDHRIDQLLTDLIAQNMLVTNLRAPMTHLNALNHVCAELKTADALTVPEAHDLVFRLYEIRDELTGKTRTTAHADLAGAIDRMSAVSDVTPTPLVVDTALGCAVQIPERVLGEAQDAITALYRLSPHPFGYQRWRDYHRRFRQRYGDGALVPVLEVVADSGLGPPADYLGSARGRSARHLTERDEKLLALLQRVALDGRDEIVLTDQVVAELTTTGGGADITPVPRVEVSFEIHARSPQALDAGAFRLAITGTPRPGSSMAGRFAHLLPAAWRAELAETYAATSSDAVAAQLAFAPRRRRNENVTRTQQFLPHVIALAEHRQPNVSLIALADLAVTADAGNLHLVQLPTGRRMEPRVPHALEAGVHTPPLARFLSEITTARSAVYKPFDFGAAAHLPYLPRVRRKRTILAPARWLLTADDLPGRNASPISWDTAFEAWRARLRVPRHVSLVERDQRLPLDLTHRVHRLLLRTRLDHNTRLELREAPSPEDIAWIGRAHEVLVTLTTKTPTAQATAPLPVSDSAAGELPGRATVLHARVHGHPSRHDELLLQYLPDLLAAWGDPPRWWFRRHRDLAQPDADPYLALYVDLPSPDAYGEAAAEISRWADHLRNQRLVSHLTLAPYEPQAGRYGTGPALRSAQNVFAADSAAALAQIRLASSGTPRPQALAAASMVNRVTRLAPSTAQGLEWLTQALPQHHGPLDRGLRDQALNLADRIAAGPAADTNIALTWRHRALAITAYRDELARQRDPMTVAHTLLHHHHVRVLPVDPDLEAVTNRLARACALRHLAKTTT